MADNLRVRFMLEASTSTDYSRPYQRDQYEREFDPDEVQRMRVEASTGGSTITISHIGTPSMALFKNASTTSGEDVTLVYQNTAGTVTVALGIGEVHFTEDITVSSDPTATSDAGTPLIDVWVAGT